MNNMRTEIKHCGVVDSVDDGCVKVRIVQSSACASCKVASHCNASEHKEKIVEVENVGAGGYAVGDNVVVIASQRTGTIAVVLSSVIPLFLLMSVLASVLAVTGDEAVAALAGIGSLVPYYLIIYMLRDKIKARLAFRIERG